ncbi:hypothetical protein CC80DRAFT_514191 [Byssothecium circinans]|uniref:FAD linked oxidase N-terminal domain-containing protein n=1 Tax=Byssothecium circinans TaxID=147558 RepID=A0A6A5UF40_9PLEO|nr:hypothetical protein CC80DRAFT_514191 [Byssothecium circinans]
MLGWCIYPALKPFNIRVPYKPATVAIPATIRHIQDAVACGAINGVLITPRSGGHSYAPHELGSEDEYLLVGMKNFASVTVDQVENTTVIGTARRLGDVATALQNQGKKDISHGTCQGASAAFGIVTNFKYRTFTAPDSNIVFNHGIQLFSATQLANIITALQDFTRNSLPLELNMHLFLSSYTSFSGVYYGSQIDFNKVIQPLLSKLGVSENFFAKSLMPDWLPPAAITALINYWAANARSNSRQWYLFFDSHGGNNSAIANVPDGDTAYAHRNTTLKMRFYDRVASGTYNTAAITDASPGSNFGMYINYGDASLGKEEAHSVYQLGHYEKLVGIRWVYDSKGVLGGPQLFGS